MTVNLQERLNRLRYRFGCRLELVQKACAHWRHMANAIEPPCAEAMRLFVKLLSPLVLGRLLLALCYGTVVLSSLSVCNFGLLWTTSGCMDQDATWYGGRPRLTGSGDIVLHRDPAAPRKGAQQLANTVRDLRTQPASVNRSPCLLWRNGRPSQQLLSSCYVWFRQLTVLWIGFCLTGSISLCLDSLLYMYYCVHV